MNPAEAGISRVPYTIVSRRQDILAVGWIDGDLKNLWPTRGQERRTDVNPGRATIGRLDNARLKVKSVIAAGAGVNYV